MCSWKWRMETIKCERNRHSSYEEWECKGWREGWSGLIWDKCENQMETMLGVEDVEVMWNWKWMRKMFVIDDSMIEMMKRKKLWSEIYWIVVYGTDLLTGDVFVWFCWIERNNQEMRGITPVHSREQTKKFVHKNSYTS